MAFTLSVTGGHIPRPAKILDFPFNSRFPKLQWIGIRFLVPVPAAAMWCCTEHHQPHAKRTLSSLDNMRLKTLWFCFLLTDFGSLLLNTVDSASLRTLTKSMRPQIILRDGSMVFQSAVGKNIHFESNGGQVFLNQANLLELAQTVTAAANTINSLHAGVLSDFESRLRLLETTVLGSLGVENRVSQLEQTISNGTSGADLPGNIGAKIKTLNAKGTLCDVDVNECAQFAGTDLGCQNGATCINRIGTYECQCAPGFVGLHCTRKDKGCSKNNPQELCGHGICINQEGVSDGYTCLCDQGWTKSPNSKACTQDVDECTSGRPACSKNPPVSCINLPGTFHCGPCPQGYTGNGFYCVDIDECQINNGGCSMNPSVQCINTQGSRVCGACPPGYQGDGVTCTYLGACRINNGGCHPLAQCLENSAISQSYVQCICPSGYAGSGIGPSGCIPTAVAPISGGSNICQPNPCIHGTCIVAGTSFICRCYSGYTGATCGNAVNPCDSNPCQNSGTCVPQGNGYYCRCSPFTTGMHCEQQQMSCGGRLRSPSGTLKFPPSNEGINYPSQVSCGWLIVTNSTQVLNVTFKSFNLEESPECSFDWLQIHDGHSSAYQLIGRYCGSRIPNAIISTHNVLYLWFRSDRSNQRDVCGGDIVFQSHGSLSSPGYPGKYPTNRDCEWRLTAPNRKRIVLHFYTMNIESHSNCSFDFVEIRDGYDNRMVKKFCNTSLPEPLTTPSRRAVIRFHSDGTDCGGVLTSGSGLIVPPLDPDSNKYLHRATCEWVIQLPEGERIKIEFLKLNLENHRSCIFDRVELPRPYTSLGHIVTIIFLTDSSVALEGFKIKYEEVCGGIFGEEAGHITSPMYPSKYTRNKNCIYEIQQPLGKSITLNFFDFTLEAKSRYSSRCYDFVEIRDGHDEKAPLLGQYCGTQFPPTIVSTYNYLWLKFHTDSSREFKACGGIIRNQEGTIQTPRYPNFYPNNHMCRWVIVADAGNVINLNWINFNLEGETGMFGDACSFDYVEVYENVTEGQPGVRVGNRRYCGNMSPPNMTSTSNIVTIVFRTDYSIRFTGFIARYLLTDASNLCSANFVSSTGTILSPGYPSSYPHNIDCTWTISVPSGQQILLNVSDFWLERHSNCMWDYLEIRNGILASSPLIGRYCGREISTPIPSISNHLYLRFKTDYSHSLRGFNITWDGTITGCGGTLTGKSGHIVSPYYPHEYSINTECFYKISTSQGSIVQVIFLDFDLEYSRRCLYDYLAVYGGQDTTSPALHPGLCHKLTQEMKLTSSGSNMLLTFTADSSYSGRGFKLSYKSVDSVCGGYFVAPSGYIHSHNFPNNYDPHDDCLWYIEVEKNHVVQLSFLTFDLEMSNNCTYDYVKVFDGNSTESPEIATLCGNVLPNITSYRSTGNTMVLRMKADGSLNGPGFSANYTTACGARIVTEDYGTISLANAINANRENQNCSWVIIGAQPQDRVTLTITHMDLSPRYENFGDVCEYGYLEVYDGEDKSSSPLGPFCGSSAPPPIISQGSALLLHLVSMYGAHYGYFSASYSVIQGACGGNFTSEHGAFSSPEYPNTYSINSECVWTISTSPGNRVTVGFRAFELEQSDNCNKDYLEVRANSAEGNLIGVYCQDLPSNITASQTLWIKFHSDSDGTARGFLADYSLIHGNELEGQSGQIASPLYPRPYLQESEYSWRVTVAVGSAIRITFREFYIESFSDSCDMFLAIYDGYDDTAPELMKKCGTMVPDPITSSSNMVYIYMSSMGVRHGSLFFLEWLQVERTPVPRPTPLRNLTCGGMIYLGNHTSNSSVSEYILTSPGYPYGYRHGLRCEWIIQTPQLYHPVILFTAMDLERNTRCTVDYVSVYSATDQSGEWKLLNTLCQTNATLTPPIDAYNMMKVVFRTDYSVNRTGFAAKVYPACGGSVKMPNGVIEVDNTTSGSSQNYYMECQWNITVRSGRTIKVAFDRFYIRNDRSDIAQCGDLYLKIQNGHYADSPSLGQPKYCGTELPVIPESTSNHISITYKNIRGGQGFKLRFFEESVSCGGSYTLSRFDNSMEISSPGFPNSPLPHIECIWTFMAPGGEALQVDFDPIFDFQSSKDCEADYVELRDGGTQNSRLINRFCIRPPSTQRSTQNMIWIKFFTNTYDHPSRFKANVSIARCGGIIRNWRGDIRSPGYPRQYPSNTQCTWRIEVVHYSSITIGFQDVDLPISTPCNSSDYVSVSEYNPFLQTTRLVNTVCGQNPPEPIQVASMTALIDFKSFGAQPDRYKGFSLNFSSTYENCGGELTAPSGEIKNPDYPSGTRYRSCTWTIIVPKSRRVTVDLVTVDMDLAERYSSDISFFNYQYSYFIDSLWRNRTLRRVESSSNIMKVYFYIRTNRPVRFLMRYSSDQPAACGGVLQGSNGSFPYPVISGSSFFCMWEYNSESSINGTLALTFRNVTIGRNSNFYSCRYSGSKIKVTSADEKQILYSTCGNYTKPQTIVSPFSKTKIIIAMSRVAMTYEGQYSISPCGGVLTGPEENVTSPGYPNNYPPNVHCAWAVTFPEELRITIKFNAMQLEETCSNDYLLIYNGPLPTSPLIDRFCGSHLREDIISQGNTLWIEFHSNGDSQFKGFSLSLSSLSSGCGGVIHNKDRAILSPNYPSQYPPNMECEWEIRADEGYFIQLRFVDRFQLEDSDNCDNDFVEIYDYSDSSYVSIKKVCGREVHRVMTSTGTRMKIRFKSNQNIQGDGFKIQWTPQCGGVIENVTEGHIVSPSYPREYGMNLDCNYTVKMPGHWMRAEFDTFELEGQGGTCRYDNVTIVGPPRWSSIMTLGPYCGTNKPPPFVSSNYFSLIFKTDFSVSRSGFLVRFKSITSCGGPINEPGALSSPDTYVEFYHVQINCTWTITAPANSVVVVRFSSFQLPSFCDPSMNGLTIYDGPFVNQRYRMATYCGNLDKSPPVIKSTGNKMVLEYLTYSFSSRSNSFNADVLFTYGESDWMW
ncbi:Cubilin homolog [Gryllus bimaculatus]|nr:Cubilin homolog [Gryllus bimaculatus]